MRHRFWSFISVVCGLVIAGGVLAQVRTLPKPPTWPQAFALPNAEQASFVVPITSPGVIGHRQDDIFWTTPWLLNRNYNWSVANATVDVSLLGPAGARLNSYGVLTSPMPIFPFQPVNAVYVSVHSWTDIWTPMSGGNVANWVT